MDNRKSNTAEDCVNEILRLEDIIRDKKEKAKEYFDRSNAVTKGLNKIGKVITILIQSSLALISLYFVMSPKEFFDIQNIEWILFVISVLTLIYVTILEVKPSNKFDKYMTVLKYYHKIEEIVDNIIVEVSKNNNDFNYIFDSYLKVQQLCRDYELEEVIKN